MINLNPVLDSINFYDRFNFHIVNKSLKCGTWVQSQKWHNDLSLFPRQTIQYHSIPSLSKKAEVKWFYEDLHDLELIPKKDVLFIIIGDWNAKVRSQEIPGVTVNFDLGVQKEAGQRLTEFCLKNTLVIANTHFQQHKRQLYTYRSPEGRYQIQIGYILCS